MVLNCLCVLAVTDVDDAGGIDSVNFTLLAAAALKGFRLDTSLCILLTRSILWEEGFVRSAGW